MLDEKICKLREKLNNCISNGEDYSVIYKVSVELDDLIAKYYDKNLFGVVRKWKNNNGDCSWAIAFVI